MTFSGFGCLALLITTTFARVNMGYLEDVLSAYAKENQLKGGDFSRTVTAQRAELVNTEYQYTQVPPELKRAPKLVARRPKISKPIARPPKLNKPVAPVTQLPYDADLATLSQFSTEPPSSDEIRITREPSYDEGREDARNGNDDYGSIYAPDNNATNDGEHDVDYEDRPYNDDDGHEHEDYQRHGDDYEHTDSDYYEDTGGDDNTEDHDYGDDNTEDHGGDDNTEDHGGDDNTEDHDYDNTEDHYDSQGNQDHTETNYSGDGYVGDHNHRKDQKEDATLDIVMQGEDNDRR